MELIIVESPKKAKTIEKFLKGKYKVLGSGGHIRELPEKEFGIDFNNNFKPTYEIEPKHVKIVNELRKQAEKADRVFLATDPDREGEAIAWHLDEVLECKDKSCRIKYNEISEKAVRAAINNPGSIDYRLVNSQQARRVLDRIVGYKLSPFVRARVENGESAGRVQSVAVRLIVDLDRKIKEFVPEEYWTINAILNKIGDSNLFKASLVSLNGKKFKPSNKDEAEEAYKVCTTTDYIVDNVKKAESISRPLPPYTTSTMQQDASIKLKLTADQIMKLAQDLYEGIETPKGHVAFVTYIRTDSTRISQDAQKECLEFIKNNFGDKYCPNKPNIYSVKNNAQDAHEAIRPIDVNLSLEQAKEMLDKNHFSLYKLIYERYLASQMSNAIYDTVQLSINCGPYGFKASGRTIKFKGFTIVYDYESKKNEDDGAENKILPELVANEKLNLNNLEKTQKFTKPPVRYSDSTLVKTMEENGIGRPSTYATIIQTLVKRGYIVREDKKYLVPTEAAFKATDLLVKHFKDIVDIQFTAEMESKLDEIAENGVNWQDVVRDFYYPFIEELKVAQRSGEETDTPCPSCGAMMVKKYGKYGEYLECPNCRTTLNSQTKEEKTDIKCNVCGHEIVKKITKNGEYYYCNTCMKSVYPFEKVSDTLCPVCGKKLVTRTGSFGEYYFCEGCSFTMGKNDKILEEDCPECGKKLIDTNGKYGRYIRCCSCSYRRKTNTTPNTQVGTCPKCGKPLVIRYNRANRSKSFYGCSGYPNCKYISNEPPKN